MNAPQASCAKRVLMIDYLFPPLAGPGIQRTLGYVRYLPRYGWNPIVLTVRDGDHALYDATLLARIPEHLQVVRTPSVEPVRFVRKVLRCIAANRSVSDGAGALSGRPLWLGASWVRDLEKWVLFPDRRIGWLPFGVRRALQIHRATPYDIVYSTSTNIMTGHLMAYWVARRLRTPWIADFQDAWLSYYSSMFPSSIHRRLAMALERLVVYRATRITVATEPHRDMMVAAYPTLPPEKIAIIPMGFDPTLFEGIKPSPSRAFTVTHLGSFYSTRSPAPFLRALGRLLARRPEWTGRIDVRLIGTFDAENLKMTEALLDAHGLRVAVRLLGVMPYRQALTHLLSSEVLLIIADDGLWGRKLLASKVLEYLAARRPILALAPPGVTAEIVERARAGVIVPPLDEGAIERALEDLMTAWAEGRLTFRGDSSYIDRFSWPNVTAAIADLLHACVCSPTPATALPDGSLAIPTHGGE